MVEDESSACSRRLASFLVGAVALPFLLVLPRIGFAGTEIEWVTVNGVGNACRFHTQGCFGGVDYPYRISKFEITVDQYVDFLNAVASISDPNSLSQGVRGIARTGSVGSYSYQVNSGFSGHPLSFVGVFDAFRFANWLDNGQPNGLQDSTTTEDGAYTLASADTANVSVTRNVGARVFVSSEDEWYKAAYYNEEFGNYFLFPTSSFVHPVCSPPTSSPNHANCDRMFPEPSHGQPVGSYTGSASPSGTFDQGGNMSEFTDTFFSQPPTEHRVIRGGHNGSNQFPQENLLSSVTRGSIRPTAPGGGGNGNNGFRISGIPDQVVYLEFDAVAADLTWCGNPTRTVNKPSYGSASDRIAIAKEVQRIYSQFDIMIVTDQPTSGDYSTIYIGGDFASLALPWLGPVARFLKNIDTSGTINGCLPDVGNLNLKDNGFVFTDFILGGNDAVARVAAHEIGHLLGLYHVADNNQLMTPVPNGLFAGSEFGGVTEIALNFDEFGYSGQYTQDSFACLSRNVGPLALLEPASRSCHPQIPGQAKPFLLNIEFFAGTIYSATVALYNFGGSEPVLVDLGTIGPGANPMQISTDVADLSRVAVFGSSIAGGEIDVFSSAEDLSGRTLDGLSPEELSYAGVDAQGDPINLTIDLHLQPASGAPTVFGSMTAMPQAVPEPAFGVMLGAGLFCLVRLRRRQEKTG